MRQGVYEHYELSESFTLSVGIAMVGVPTGTGLPALTPASRLDSFQVPLLSVGQLASLAGGGERVV